MEVSKICHFGNSIGLKQKTNLEYRRANLISERMNLIFVTSEQTSFYNIYYKIHAFSMRVINTPACTIGSTILFRQ